MGNSLRLYSGLILFTFVTGHLINHSFGIISIGAASAASEMLIDPWRTLVGTVLLGGAVVVHAGCAVWSLWVRRSLKMPAWELMQMVLGFMIPLLLAAHVAATRGLIEISDFDPSYEFMVGLYWTRAPLLGVLQALALIIVWTHGCLGIHTWLRLKPWYAHVMPILSLVAVALPVAALGGYVAMGVAVVQRSVELDWWLRVVSATGREPWMVEFVNNTEAVVRIAVVATLLSLILVQVFRRYGHRIINRPHLHYMPGSRKVPLVPGATLLESIRAAGIPHASICGGRGRCSTCRVRVVNGAEHLSAAAEIEQKVLARHTSSHSVRLACQLRPTKDLQVSALVKADVTPVQLARSPDYMQGRELSVAFLFVDLRGSSKLCEDRLPFDVVFILNQFFAELSKALEETGGHYAQFNGDGLMAIYGLKSPPELAARKSLRGAQAMINRIEALNHRLGEELSEPLRIGIGIHLGEAVIGSMGPPSTPIVSALGDNVNIAARLESLTKEFSVPLVVSEAVINAADIDVSGLTPEVVPVRGRAGEIRVYPIGRPDDLVVEMPDTVEAAE